MGLIERVQARQGAVDVDGPVPAALPQQPDDPLRLAQVIGSDDVAALRELRH